MHEDVQEKMQFKITKTLDFKLLLCSVCCMFSFG